MEQPLTITDQIIALRRELGLNQAEFALRVGLANKASVSLLERGGPCSLPVALAIEALSGGRIDAAALNEGVRASRHAQNIKSARALVHSAMAGVPEGDVPAGADEGADRRIVVCDVCERRVDDERPNACTFVDCPHSGRTAVGQAA